MGKKDKKEDEDALLVIYVTEEMNFKYHDECYADFQDDFVIMLSKIFNKLSEKYCSQSLTMLQINSLSLYIKWNISINLLIQLSVLKSVVKGVINCLLKYQEINSPLSLK